MKKGFTLIELLAVIVILAIIALIAVPIVLNIINDAKKSSQEESIKMYAKAIEDGVANYYLKYPNKSNVNLETLENENLINYKGEKIICETTQIYNGKVFLADCSIGNNKIDYEYGKLEVEKPELNNGLIPVIYDEDNWKVIDKNDPNWYDYSKQKWANAVTLLPGVTKNVGDIVKLDGTEASMILVWIPRYEYKYTNLGNQFAGGTKDLPGKININFIPKETISSGSDEYKIHSAFIFGNKQLSGIWIGKFEISHETLSSNSTENNLGCSTTNCANAERLRTLPNVANLRYNDVSNFWYGIKSIENTTSFELTNMDTHMIKNNEWNAVAYLSQSRYGKYGNPDYEEANKEIYSNKDAGYITGKSNGTPSQATTNTQCQYNDMTKLVEGKGLCGPGASTTGNIYGVYDMSGGSSEYMMGLYKENGKIYVGNGTVWQSGFNGWLYHSGNPIEKTNGVNLPDRKYYNLYTKEDENNYICDEENCNGQNFLETKNWYNNSFKDLDCAHSWVIRNKISTNSSGGIFYYGAANGLYSDGLIPSTRLIITSKK